MGVEGVTRIGSMYGVYFHGDEILWLFLGGFFLIIGAGVAYLGYDLYKIWRKDKK